MTEDILWKNYKKRVRRDVRKAEKSSITIHEVTHPEEIDTLFNLYLQTMKRNEAYNVWTRQTLYAIYHRVVQKGWGKIFLARLKDEIIAGIILIFSLETTYYFFAASDQKYLSLCPNDLLVHQGICLTIQQGRRFFDLMTSQKDDVALMNFKEKWGAKKYPFYFYEKSLNPFRAWIWKRVWWLMNTSAGAQLIRWWRGR
jgi:lipid II:glycine glycyltransferase (peptidoglycan interpeptide bridge formation enzyme)